MARRGIVLDRYSPAWSRVFSFFTEPEEYPAVERLQAIGVRELGCQYGRTAGGFFFTNLSSVVSGKDKVVDVEWLRQVRELCEGMAPQIFSETIQVAGADGDDPDTDCTELVADGDLLLFVQMRLDQRIHMSVDVVLPVSDVAETPAAG